MAQTYRKVRTYHDPAYGHDEMVADENQDALVVNDNPLLTKVQMIIQYVVGLVVSILTLRFVLALFGANSANGFVDFIYDITAPLVAPFQGLFNISTRVVAGARFEYETLVAVLVYALIGVGIVKLIDILKR